MATFDTTKIQQNQPGLVYATPQAMPGKYSTLGGVLDVANTTIKGAVAFDKQMTLNEADALANKLTKQYETISPSNKAYLENQLARDPGNEKIQGQLDVITKKYELAKEQGIMTPYEFERRVLQETQDLSSANPAYADEIAARVNKTLGNGGTLDLLQQDTAFMKAQSDAQIAQMKEIKSYLLDKKIMTLGMSEPVILNTFQKELGDDRMRLQIQETLDDKNLSTKVKQARVREYITSIGGPAKEGANIIKSTLSQLEAVSTRLASGEINIKEASLARDNIFVEADEVITSIATVMDDDEAYKAVYESTKKRLEDITKSSSDRMFGKDTKEYFETQNSINEAKEAFNFEERYGYTPKMLETQQKLLTNLDDMLKNMKVRLPQSQQQAMTDNIMMLTTNSDSTFGPGSLKAFKENPEFIINNLDLINGVVDTQILEGQEISLDDRAFNVLNHTFNTVKAQTNSNTKFTVAKKLLNKINSEGYERTLTYMTTGQGSTWVEDLPETIMFVEGATNKQIINNAIPKEGFIVQDGKIRGTAYAFRAIAEQLNTTMELNGKFEGTKITDEIATKYLNKFSFGSKNETKKEYTDGEFTVRIKQ